MKDNCGWIWDNLQRFNNKCATNPGNYCGCIKNLAFAIEFVEGYWSRKDDAMTIKSLLDREKSITG